MKQDRRQFCKDLIVRGFGMINTGNYLGLMFGPLKIDDPTLRVPNGWVYVCTKEFPDEQSLEDALMLSLEELERGRSNWPERS